MHDDDDKPGQLLGPNQPAVDGRSAAAWNGVMDGLPLTALEYKAVYVAGLVRHLAESAGLCLEADRHLPAFLLAMGGVEALGAVLAQVPREDNQVVVETAHRRYTVRDCLNRRDFTAHGGAVLTSGIVLDEMLTVGLLCRLASSLDRWWDSLKSKLGVQRLLAVSDVIPLGTSGRVVFVHDLWQALLSGARPGGELQHQSWRRHC